jgi:hypothetical protein
MYLSMYLYVQPECQAFEAKAVDMTQEPQETGFELLLELRDLAVGDKT